MLSAHPADRRQGIRTPDGQDGENGGGRREEEQGRFLREHAPALGVQQGSVEAEPLQRIEIEQEQDGRQADGHGFRQHCGRPRGNRRGIPHASAPRSNVRPVVRPEIAEDGDQVEEAAEHITPLGRPRHGFDPERVHREQQGRGQGRDPESQPVDGKGRAREGKKPYGDQEEEGGIGGMEG